MYVQFHFHTTFIPSPFSLIIPTLTLHDRLRVVVFHSLKKPTGIRTHIRQAAEVLDHSFTGAVTDCGHVERTTLFLTAVESRLSEGQVSPEFFQCAHCDTHFFVGKVSDSAVWWLNSPVWEWNRLFRFVLPLRRRETSTQVPCVGFIKMYFRCKKNKKRKREAYE